MTHRNILRKMLLAVVIGLPAALLAGGFGTLTGTVTDAKTKKPVSGAIVTVKVGQGMAGQTDQEGRFLFNNIVPTGSYTVSVSKSGFETKDVAKVKVESGVKTLNVSLTAKAAAGSPPPATGAQPSNPPPSGSPSSPPPASPDQPKKGKNQAAPASSGGENPPASPAGGKAKKKSGKPRFFFWAKSAAEPKAN